MKRKFLEFERYPISLGVLFLHQTCENRLIIRTISLGKTMTFSPVGTLKEWSVGVFLGVDFDGTVVSTVGVFHINKDLLVERSTAHTIETAAGGQNCHGPADRRLRKRRGQTASLLPW